MATSEPSDAELLGQYVRSGSEDAFTELARRHLDLVYSAALRQTEGDAHSAMDVAQTVFTELARQASRLELHPTLTGWLYTTTRQVAAHSRRARMRREQREQKAFAMQELDPARDSEEWRQLRPLLDEAMHELPEPDRVALLLRFFEGRELRRVGEVLGLSENAARMRVQRALEKLRDVLARKGVATATAGLATVLAANTSTAAPAALLGAVATASTLAAGTGGASTIVTAKFSLLAMKTSLSYATIIVLASVPLLLQQWQIQRAREDLANARALAAQSRIARPGTAPAGTGQITAEELSRLQRDEQELARLREEAQKLQAAVSGPTALLRNKAVAALQAAEAEKEQAEAEVEAVRLRVRRINQLKNIGLAARIFASNNGDSLPRNLEQIRELAGEHAQEFDRFEFYPQPRVIFETEPGLFLFREKEPRRQTDGKWERAYTMIDGSVQNLHSDTADFTLAEQKWGGIASPEPPDKRP